MYLKIVGSCFGVLCLILSSLLLYVNTKKNKTVNTSFAGLLGFFILLFVLACFLMVFFVNGACLKILIFLIGLSPFLVGRLATYKTRNLFSYIQISSVFLTGVFFGLITAGLL